MTLWRYDEQDSGPVGSLSSRKSEFHGKNSQQKVNLTNIGENLGTRASVRDSIRGGMGKRIWISRLWHGVVIMVLHSVWGFSSGQSATPGLWKLICWLEGLLRHVSHNMTTRKTSDTNNFPECLSSEPVRTFRNTTPILIFRISNALGNVSLRPNIIYDFGNVNLN